LALAHRGLPEQLELSISTSAPISKPARQHPRRSKAHRPTPRPAARPTPSSALDASLDAAMQAPPPETKSFAQFGLPAPLVTALARRGMTEPFAIQARTLSDGLDGRDVLGRAQTGSGKTLAFGLPMLARLHTSGTRRVSIAPRALVLVPTRELASQVGNALSPLAQALAQRVTTVYGGAPIGRQIDQLRRGTDIVVATPGRLIDLMERGAVSLGRQLMLFSATLDRGVDRLVSRYLNDPAAHAVAPAVAPVAAMEHRVFVLRAEDKVAIATEIARRPARTLFFVRTKYGADRLARQLARAGVDAVAIHGNLNQNQRIRALDAFVSGRARVLVATDVAARGLHVDDLDLVVHFDPPTDHKDYLHRSGRTARAGAGGTVVSFVERTQAREVERMHAAATVVAATTSVSTGHPAVREIAVSGDAVVVRPMRAHEAPPQLRHDRHDRRSRGRRTPKPRSLERPA
jgi:superfamily II DNA/RNA helicase